MDLKAVLTAQQVSELTGWNLQKIYYAARERIIPSDVLLRWGNRYYFRRTPLLKWLGEEFVKPSSEEASNN